MPPDHYRILAELLPGSTVYIQGAGGEPLALREVLSAAPQALARVNLTGCFLPGFNEFDYSALHPDARLTTFMLPGGFQQAERAENQRPDHLHHPAILASLPHRRVAQQR